MNKIDISFPSREGHPIIWKLKDSQIKLLENKYGDKFRTHVIPKIRAKVRSWYGKKSPVYDVKINNEYYNLKTGRFKKNLKSKSLKKRSK